MDKENESSDFTDAMNSRDSFESRLLEIKQIKSNIDLSNAIIAKLKKDVRTNMLFLSAGAILTFTIQISTGLLVPETESTEVQKLEFEVQQLMNKVQIDYNKLNSEITSSKNEIDSLKTYKLIK